MQLELILLNTFVAGLCVAQTSYNNGLWTPSPTTTQYCDECQEESTTTSYYESWTTYTSLAIYGTVTVTITSTVSCPTTTEAPVWVTETEVIDTTECNECQPIVTSTCDECEPVYTSYYYGTTYNPATTTQQVPYTTITSGAIVYVIMSSTAAEAGQVTTNGVVQLISSAGTEDANLVRVVGVTIAGALLVLVML